MKSLEEREADRARRAEEAKKAAKQADEIRATGTMAEGKTDRSSPSGGSYDDMTVADLKAELENRGIEYNSSDKKADLVAALEEDDAG